jgi:hypothetical protein
MEGWFPAPPRLTSPADLGSSELGAQIGKGVKELFKVTICDLKAGPRRKRDSLLHTSLLPAN